MNTCRMCGGNNLEQWLDLGLQPHSDHFHKQNEPEMFYPLGVSQCQDCGLNQLTHIVAKEDLYLKDYLYESSITKTAQKHWEEFAISALCIAGLKDVGNALIVDIGSNDGTLLSKFKQYGHRVVGIDPTPEATNIAIERGIPTVQRFFDKESCEEVIRKEGKADIITGTNVFAHIDDLDSCMKDVDALLGENGVFIFESPYFGDFIEGLEMDTVYHQHLSYLSMKPLIPFLNRHGFEPFFVERRPLHGGVFRVYIARKGERPVDSNVLALAESENWRIRDLKEIARLFQEEMKKLLRFCLDADGEIAVVSSPAKGNTLLNYSGIGRFVSFATDKSTLKQGRFLPGTGIEVFSDEELIKRQPKYAIVLAWNFFDEIVKNNPNYKGKWIRPLPKFEII